MEAFIGVIITVLIIAVVGWFGIVQQRKAAANLRAGAERLGLKFTPSAGIGKEGPRADGVIRGREARFWSYETGSGKHRKFWVAVALSTTTQGRLLLSLQPQGFGTKLAELFGGALLIFGSGPVRGFAVVHCLGILTSMFSAILVSRAMVNLVYGRQKKLQKVAIGTVWKPGLANQ